MNLFNMFIWLGMFARLSFAYGTAQRQLDAHTRVAGSALEGDISTGL